MPRQANTGLELRGDLQAEVMEAVWRLGEATVDDVRAEQPKRRRSGYTTLQTVMNRLAERGLLTRKRRGRAFVYKPRYEEHEYLARTISGQLAEASPSARRAALVSLIGGLEPDDLDEVAQYAKRVQRTRRGGNR
jgi:predicted transcriptional regulator